MSQKPCPLLSALAGEFLAGRLTVFIAITDSIQNFPLACGLAVTLF